MSDDPAGRLSRVVPALERGDEHRIHEFRHVFELEHTASNRG
jgi:hypothetical protein